MRWRLQFWHGLLLAVVLAGFVATGVRLRRSELYHQADEQLEQRLGPVAAMFRPARPPPPPRGPGGPGGPGLSPGFDPSPQGEQSLPPGVANLFGGTSGDVFYYIAWNRDGVMLARSAGAPPDVPPPDDEGAPAARMRGTLREVGRFLPSGECVLTGCDLGRQLADLTRFGWFLSGAGTVVFGCGLAIGWWITDRALQPLTEISATAGRIARGDLSQRIPPAETDDELGELAGVLNETFDRLEANFARQARFTADASHELRTPITVLLTQTQAMLARERSPEEYRASLAACERAARRMHRLVESLLALARLDSGDLIARREPCDLASIAGETVELLRPLAAEAKITIKVDDLAPAPCHGDPDRLAQIVTNLVCNAIQHNRPGGEVTVAAGHREGRVFVSVADTGPGIAAEDLPHIFERFYRADKARAGAAGRTGLGLAITQAIVDSHDGLMEVSSEVGRGSIFTVSFPPQRAEA
jgi:signal transduction histidine kinase